MVEKIPMKTPLVELDGDEMTRILWSKIKEKLLHPYIALKVEYYDLSLRNRDDTSDEVTKEAAKAIMQYGVGVKCATITPNLERMKEYSLKKMWPSPNGTIRSALDGTVFRKPILVENIKPSVRSWQKPIVIARHAYGDVYQNKEYLTLEPGKAELVFTTKGGIETRQTIAELPGPGVIQGIHNLEKSIESFARSCFIYAVSERLDMWFATKDTISKIYDSRFKEIFERIYHCEFEQQFQAKGITYFYTLIDDVVARVMRSTGGFLWACKNYDGDVMSDMVASAFGSLAMMTSMLVSPQGHYEYEASHGTVQQHYYNHRAGKKTSTNCTALIFAWTGALRKRAELDQLPELADFADKIERSTLETILEGKMTGDLARLAEPTPKQILNSDEFLDAIVQKCQRVLA